MSQGTGIVDDQVSVNAPVSDGSDAATASAADFAEMFRAATTRGPDAVKGGPLLGRRRVTFTLDGAVGALRHDGAPVFSNAAGEVLDLVVVLESLTSAEEMRSVEAVTAPGHLPWLKAKAQLCEVAGKRLTATEKEWLWEAIGEGGRQACVSASQQIGGLTEGVMGKLQSSITVG